MNSRFGQVLDFFSAHNTAPEIQWHNETTGPCAYVVVRDYDLAEKFRDCFGIKWLTSDEQRERRDEDTYRASKP
jgi:hypothetical protein